MAHTATQPTVLILGGFLTAPPMYRPLVGRLLDRGAAAVVVAPSGRRIGCWRGTRGIGPSARDRREHCAMRFTCRAMRRRRAAFGDRPLAGGVTARLLTAPEPLPGEGSERGDGSGRSSLLALPIDSRPGGIGARMTSGRQIADATVRGPSTRRRSATSA